MCGNCDTHGSYLMGPGPTDGFSPLSWPLLETFFTIVSAIKNFCLNLLARYLIYDVMAINSVPTVNSFFVKRYAMIEEEILKPRAKEKAYIQVQVWESLGTRGSRLIVVVGPHHLWVCVKFFIG